MHYRTHFPECVIVTGYSWAKRSSLHLKRYSENFNWKVFPATYVMMNWETMELLRCMQTVGIYVNSSTKVVHDYSNDRVVA